MWMAGLPVAGSDSNAGSAAASCADGLAFVSATIPRIIPTAKPRVKGEDGRAFSLDDDKDDATPRMTTSRSHAVARATTITSDCVG
jgi:hypothetical protein